MANRALPGAATGGVPSTNAATVHFQQSGSGKGFWNVRVGGGSGSRPLLLPDLARAIHGWLVEVMEEGIESLPTALKSVHGAPAHCQPRCTATRAGPPPGRMVLHRRAIPPGGARRKKTPRRRRARLPGGRKEEKPRQPGDRDAAFPFPPARFPAVPGGPEAPGIQSPGIRQQLIRNLGALAARQKSPLAEGIPGRRITNPLTGGLFQRSSWQVQQKNQRLFLISRRFAAVLALNRLEKSLTTRYSGCAYHTRSSSRKTLCREER